MKLTSLLIFCFLTAKLGAATLTVPQLAEPLFAGLSFPPLPAWLNPEAWDTLRVTTRGDATPSGALRAIFAKDGAVITIR